MRAIFLTLLVANLLFLAWAKWIDAPRDAGAHDALAHLPRLQLVGEKAAPNGANGPIGPTDPNAASGPNGLNGPNGTNGPSGPNAPNAPTDPNAPKPTATNSPRPAAPASGPLAALAPVVAEKVALQLPDLPQLPRCTSVGPFNDIAHAARAAGLLTQRGFKLHQRAEEGETIEGYWVYVGGLNSDQDVNEVVARLEKHGFTDAHVMKNFSTNRRISVGMFSTQERAEKRAAAVKAMGLSPEVGERRFPGTIYWVDVALASPEQKPPQEYLFADIGRTRVQMQPCPPGLTPVNPEAPANPVPRASQRTTVASAPESAAARTKLQH
ncbi:MAG: SPOR domain-containing protein [Proteobacteria bacterium]|nr:SPOR domain-containing protein [Pseudomonadota bacterium]